MGGTGSPKESPKDCYVTITGEFGANSSQGDSGEGRPPFGMSFNCDDVGPGQLDTLVYMCGDISMKCECKTDGSDEYNRIRQSISPLGGWMLIFEMCMKVGDCEYDEWREKCKKNPPAWRQCIPLNLDANAPGLKAYCDCLEKVTGGWQIICGGGAVGSWWDYCRRRMSACLDETNGTNGYGQLASDLVQDINTGLANWFDTIPDSTYKNWCEDPVMYPGDGGGAALMGTLGEANRSAMRHQKLSSRNTPPVTEFVNPSQGDMDSTWTTFLDDDGPSYHVLRPGKRQDLHRDDGTANPDYWTPVDTRGKHPINERHRKYDDKTLNADEKKCLHAYYALYPLETEVPVWIKKGGIYYGPITGTQWIDDDDE